MAPHTLEPRCLYAKANSESGAGGTTSESQKPGPKNERSRHPPPLTIDPKTRNLNTHEPYPIKLVQQASVYPKP